jgi:flavin reductase (DIM6/NTAB) family NADH-FMN oxidoreductase RutF
VSVTPSELRTFMRAFPDGVTIVTTVDDGIALGMTVTSFTSVSLEPVLILVCLKRSSNTGRGVAKSGRLIVNVLDESQEVLARRFAIAGLDKFDAVPHRTNDAGIPIIEGALGHLDCRVEESFAAGSHDIVVCSVLEASLGEGRPLLFHEGSFRGLAG